jgi:hypothetical protein
MKNKGLGIVLTAAGVLAIAGVFVVLFLYAPGMPWFLAAVICVAFYVARKYQMKKKWLKISLMTVGGTFVSLGLVCVLAVTIPYIGLPILGILIHPWTHTLIFPIENTVMVMNDPAEVICNDPDNNVLAPYTRDGVIFVLNISGGHYYLNSFWDNIADINIADGYFKMNIYLKEKTENTTYRIKNMIFKTTEYTADYKNFEIGRDRERRVYQDDFIKEESPTYFEPVSSGTTTMYEVAIKGDYWFSFPFPESGNFSVNVEMEVESGETKANYHFTYYFKIKKKKEMDWGWTIVLDTLPSHTIWNDKSQPVTLWNIASASANAERVALLSQNDSIFSDIPGMASGGCNFMVILAVAQIMTGETLSSGQIKDIWNKAVASDILVDEGKKAGYVQSRNALANMALSQLGRSDIGISMDDTFKSSGAIKPDGALMGRRIAVPYKTGGSHYILGVNTSNNLTVPAYNPGQTGRDNTLFEPEKVEIWGYAKKTK